jgi:hypothetical protein
LQQSQSGCVTSYFFPEDSTQISFIVDPSATLGDGPNRNAEENEEGEHQDEGGQWNSAPIMLVHRPKRLAQSLRNRRVVRVTNMANSSTSGTIPSAVVEPPVSSSTTSSATKAPPKPTVQKGASTSAASSTTNNSGSTAAGGDEVQILNEIENLVKQVKSGALQMNQVIASEKHILDANAQLLDKNVNNVKAQSNHAALQDVNATTKALNGLSLLFQSPGSALKGLLFLLWKILKPVLGLVIIGAVTWFTLTFIVFSPKASPTIVMRCAQQVMNAVVGVGAGAGGPSGTAELAEAANSVGLGA